MKDKRISALGMMLVVTMALVIYTVAADTECTGQDCSVGTSLIVGNSAPIITWVNSSITITLTAESSKSVNVLFNVTDLNGYADVNDSTAQCIGNKSGESSRTSTSCSAQDQSGNDLRYNCTVSFEYYDAAASDWIWNCSVSDNYPASVYNDTATFTINDLNYVDINETTLSWSSVTPNTDDEEANAPINLDNGGNKDYGSATVTAQNATNGSNVIPATDFSLDENPGATTTQTYMADNSSVAITSWFTLSHGSGASEDLYAYVDMPTVPSGSYASIASWAIDITT